MAAASREDELHRWHCCTSSGHFTSRVLLRPWGRHLRAGLVAATLLTLADGQIPGVNQPLHCPQDGIWPGIFQEVSRGASLFRAGDYALAKEVLATAAEVATRDEREAFRCSLGLSSLYRALAFAWCSNPQLTGNAMRRANQIGLRFLHLAMNWLTHTFVSTNHDVALIDGSAWPIGLQEINEDLTAVTASITSTGPIGHKPTASVRFDFQPPPEKKLKIAIVSLCAYPPDNVLPKYATSNHEIYAQRHGYAYLVEREMVAGARSRPPAWGKILLMEQQLRAGEWDWVVWLDCDTFFMNMSVTIESVLFSYAGLAEAGAAPGDMELDPEVHMIVSEDSAMLNTGIFFVRSTPWVLDLFSRVWGSDDSPWINHPWWENAAIAWQLLKDLPDKFRQEHNMIDDDDIAGIYPPNVRLAPQAHFNSYHPITSRFLHDTWEEGKYVIAFNGVLSSSSPSVVQYLYGSYYRTACQLNGIEDLCVPVE